MSLRVWLPLTKDLRNQGLDDVTVTNNGATFNSAGKLGGCYSFNGSSYITVQDVVLQNIWSYSCWLYSETSSRGWEVVMACNINGGDADMQLGLYTRPGGNVIQNTANGQYNAGIPMTYGQWNHFVGTFDGANLKTYLNGVLVNTKAITNAQLDRPKLTIGARCRGSSYDCYFQGLLNDIRIYDHCLSPMEVKQLSQGLILHYPLSDSSNQQMNNCWSTPTFETSAASGGSSHWGASGASGTQGQSTDRNYIYNSSQTYAHWVANASTATGSYLLYQSPAFEGGYRSFQCICKEENGIEITNNVCFSCWNARSGGVANNSWTSIVPLGNGFYWCKCEGIMQDGSNDLVGIYIKPGYKVYFTFCYLENDRECCSNPFFQSNIVYDCSGFCNNGTRSGTLTISSDTPKYMCSTYMQQSNGIQNLMNPSFITNGSLSFWSKVVNNGTSGRLPLMGQNSSYYIMATHGADNFYHNQVSGAKTIYEDGIIVTKPKTDGLWHHYVITDINLTTWTTLALNLYSQYTADIYYCDIRIYATALSASDVKSLYQNSAYIDSSGNVYGAVHSEV